LANTIGIIGGTGFYDLKHLDLTGTVRLETPFGQPSDEYMIGKLRQREIVFLPRHGHGHRIMPGQINHRANIWGMKKLGVTHLLSISTVGSFRDEIQPGTLVFATQYIDRTKSRTQDTFFDQIAVHIAFADPVCPILHNLLVETARNAGIAHTPQGVYLNIEGPAFATRAESRLYRSWGADVIGMTNIFEARLCREAEIHYAPVVQVTDYDSWKEAAVDVPTILGNLSRASRGVSTVLEKIVTEIPSTGWNCECENALAHAIVTDKAKVPPAIREHYQLLLNKYW